MKKALLFLIAGAFLSSCIGVKQIGDINLISSRNVELKGGEYELIKSYAGSSSKKELKKEFKKIKAKTLEQAVSYTVKSTPGGEFVANARIYLLNGTFFIVQGDVWGVAGAVPEHKGWKVGDKVQYNRSFKKRTGVIVDLKDSENATIKEDETNKHYSLKYEKLLKIN